jgi:hypothetical protein
MGSDTPEQHIEAASQSRDGAACGHEANFHPRGVKAEIAAAFLIFSDRDKDATSITRHE